jgi:hypothetical protein
MFNNEHEPVTPETHPITIYARVNDELRKLIPYIDERVDGLADSGSYIQTFTDIASGKVNLVCAHGGGGAFVIVGGKLKIVFDPNAPQDEKNTGVFLVAPGSPAITIKVSGNLIENTPARISGIIPELVAGKTWYVEIRTRYSHSSTLLKEIRVVRSAFTLQQA